MVKFLVRYGSEVEPMPHWDVFAVDSFGRPAELIGGVINAAATHEEAAELFLSMHQEWPGGFIHVRPSTPVPPWETVAEA